LASDSEPISGFFKLQKIRTGKSYFLVFILINQYDFFARDDIEKCETNLGKNLSLCHIFLWPLLYIPNKWDKKHSSVF